MVVFFFCLHGQLCTALECNRTHYLYIRSFFIKVHPHTRLIRLELLSRGTSQFYVLVNSCVFYFCKALPSGEDDEEDSDSDSDDDDVKVTIGNIKTGAPSYMYVLLGDDRV